MCFWFELDFCLQIKSSTTCLISSIIDLKINPSLTIECILNMKVSSGSLKWSHFLGGQKQMQILGRTDGGGGGPERKSLLTDKISVLLGDTKKWTHFIHNVCSLFVWPSKTEKKSGISIFAQGFFFPKVASAHNLKRALATDTVLTDNFQ